MTLKSREGLQFAKSGPPDDTDITAPRTPKTPKIRPAVLKSMQQQQPDTVGNFIFNHLILIKDNSLEGTESATNYSAKEIVI